MYYCARAFLPLVIASGDGVLVNTSSLNGLWASLGPGMPNTAYSTAKFAVRGFTEALIEDLRTNALQARAAVVLPGSVGTDILANTRRAYGMPGPEDMSDEQAEETRDFLVTAKLIAQDAPPAEVRKTLARLEKEGKDKSLLSAAEAATIILDGVRSGAWRILVGKDAAFVDERVCRPTNGASSRQDPHIVLTSRPVTVACPSGVCTGRTAADGPSYPAAAPWQHSRSRPRW